MGVDYQAAIVVGLPAGLLSDELLEKVHKQESELEICPPYYDGDDSDDAIVGLFYSVSDTYSADILDWNQDEINALLVKFKKISGQDGKVWLSTMGY